MSKELVNKIIDKLNDRVGFEWWWKKVDHKDQEEIKAVIENLILRSSSKVVLTETQNNYRELRTELIEFLEANNYFPSVLKDKDNAINIVDVYLKNYKG